MHLKKVSIKNIFHFMKKEKKIKYRTMMADFSEACI